MILWTLIDFAFFGNQLIGIALICVWLARAFMAKIPGLVPSLLMFLLIPIVVFYLFQINLRNQTQVAQQKKGQSVLLAEIEPGAITLRDGNFHGIVYLPEIKQNVTVFGYLQDKKEQNALRHMTQKSVFKIDGELQLIQPPPNFNQFDSQAFYKGRGIVAELHGTKVDYQRPSGSVNLFDQLEAVRNNLIIGTGKLPKCLQMYVLGLLYGERSSDFRDELTGVTKLGLIHLFTISGMHVYFLVNLVMWILTLCHFEKEHIHSFLLAALPIYFVIAGAGSSLLRAILMSEERFGAKKFHLKLSALDVWSLALMINLLITPLVIFQFGCQLSYLLSLGLILTHKSGFLRQTVLLNLISVPIILYNIFEWHVLSLFANMLVVPLFSALIFPLVIIGYATGIMGIDPITNLINCFLKTFDAWLNWVAQLPGNIVFGKPNAVVVIGMVIMALLMIERITPRRIIILLILFAGSFLVIHYPSTGEVDTFDVGQGDSLLIREPRNRQITLIDTGGKLNFFANKSSQPVHYQAVDTSIHYLKSLGISKIDNICLSHQDADHIGDLPAYFQKMQVSRLYIPWGMSQNQHFMQKIKPYESQFQLVEVRNGNFINSSIRVLHPFTKGIGENDDSMVLTTDVGGLKWLFMGDLPRAQELEILEKYPNLKTDVIKLGHHGSKTSSDPSFLKSIQPKLGIISAGRNNRYGHPNQETLDTLHHQGIPFLSTQKNGMIRYEFKQNQVGKFETKWGGKQQ